MSAMQIVGTWQGISQIEVTDDTPVEVPLASPVIAPCNVVARMARCVVGPCRLREQDITTGLLALCGILPIGQ